MSRLEKHRRAGVLAATVAAGVLGVAGPAAADATVNPPSVPQGSGQDLTFRVTNTAQTPMTKVKLVLPADQPLAEIYPLSVDNWAPLTETKQLTTPLTTTDGTKATQTTASITWVAAPGKALAPGATADLTAAMGPMPGTSTMSFTLEATYADPAKGVPLSPVQLGLTPAVAGQEYTGHAAHTGGGTGTGTASDDIDDATFAALAQAADSGPSGWSIAGWIVAGLAAAVAAVALLRGRRRGPDTAVAEEPAQEKEMATTGAGTRWRYQDSPED
ncbi:DUF1775 domain-containing protein [Actinoplanes sp. N902-109]|uniref:DUF1775 domain-containing protein n=1 Tax=Actinoplanes sp. (strain N902-109) TaxID=649831 RepID=UPI000329554A|nr:DUF1775 domain-containing protein [Actinoplanes sp. N902-109]AGL18427.1 nuclear export factor GLE1 [Actinoplanes sp. N902-109]